MKDPITIFCSRCYGLGEGHVPTGGFLPGQDQCWKPTAQTRMGNELRRGWRWVNLQRCFFRKFGEKCPWEELGHRENHTRLSTHREYRSSRHSWGDTSPSPPCPGDPGVPAPSPPYRSEGITSRTTRQEQQFVPFLRKN